MLSLIITNCIPYYIYMEHVTLDFTEEELKIIKRLQKPGELINDTIKRLVMQVSSTINDKEWNNNTKEIFDEFEETFQKLAE